jgi:hypothetical protein
VDEKKKEEAGAGKAEPVIAKSTPQKRRQPGRHPNRRTRAGNAGWRERFIASLIECPNVAYACEKAGVGREVPYEWRKKDAKFAEQWERALKHGIETAAAMGWKRAYKMSDTMLIFLLKTHDPEKYGDRLRTEHTGKGGGPVEIANATQQLMSMSTAELEELVMRSNEYVKGILERRQREKVIDALPAPSAEALPAALPADVIEQAKGEPQGGNGSTN